MSPRILWIGRNPNAGFWTPPESYTTSTVGDMLNCLSDEWPTNRNPSVKVSPSSMTVWQLPTSYTHTIPYPSYLIDFTLSNAEISSEIGSSPLDPHEVDVSNNGIFAIKLTFAGSFPFL